MLERHFERAELLRQPAHAHTEVQTTARQPVDIRRFLRGVDGVPLRHEADAGPESDAFGDRGYEGEAREGLENPLLAGDPDPTVLGVRVARAVLVEQHHVLGDPERVETTLVGRAADRLDVVRRAERACKRCEQSNAHGDLPRARVRERPGSVSSGRGVDGGLE